MRRRLIAALVGVALATLLLYAGPRTFMIIDMVRQREVDGLERSADLLAEAIDLRFASGLPVDAETTEILLRDDLAATVTLADGTSFTAGPVDHGSTTRRRPLADGGTIEVVLSDDAVDDRVSDALIPVFGVGSLVVTFAVVLAIGLARRLAAPFVDLAAHTDHLGMGDVLAPRSGVPEADHLADALDRSQRRINELLRQEREFSSNASHQLRTPLAALRLRIEDVSMWDETAQPVREELDAALGEIDRLADTVTDLLELARSGGLGGWRDIDLVATVTESIDRWRPRFAAIGRGLALTPPSSPIVLPTSGRAVQHVLDVLFENALSHGRGIVDVQLQDLGNRVALRVADEGQVDAAVRADPFERSARAAASEGSGIGLALARTIAESAGARLQLVSHDPTVFELSLSAPSDRNVPAGQVP